MFDLDIMNGKKVVAFFAHTDDEMICAGTLHRLVRGGADLTVVAYSAAATYNDRTGKGEGSEGIEGAIRVAAEWHRSLDLIGVSQRGECRMFHGIMPSAELANHGQYICQTAYDLCESLKPDVAFILSPEDENTAHAEVGRQCERVMRGRVPVVVRCQFPWNYTLGRANLFVQLSEEDLHVKEQVIDAYVTQKFRYDYRGMLLHYAIADGLSVKAGPAEKFEVLRAVV